MTVHCCLCNIQKHVVQHHTYSLYVSVSQSYLCTRRHGCSKYRETCLSLVPLGPAPFVFRLSCCLLLVSPYICAQMWDCIMLVCTSEGCPLHLFNNNGDCSQITVGARLWVWVCLCVCCVKGERLCLPCCCYSAPVWTLKWVWTVGVGVCSSLKCCCVIVGQTAVLCLCCLQVCSVSHRAPLHFPRK